MNLDSLQMAPFNTTLMGVLRGVLDQDRTSITTPMLYGGSGHAFLLNIHPELCPSGPYCWNFTPFRALIRNLGIEMTEIGAFQQGSVAERDRFEEMLRRQLDAGVLCSLLNKEHQLITGYDDRGFRTAQPWPWNPNFPPLYLSYGTWAELGDEFAVTFYTVRRVAAADETTIIRDALAYALDLHDNPQRHTTEPYGAGPIGYGHWIQAMREGHGATHGAWWNAVVWAECRHEASRYYSEIAAKRDRSAKGIADQLAWHYGRIADLLQAVSDKSVETGHKIRLLEEAARTEAEAMTDISQLMHAISTE